MKKFIIKYKVAFAIGILLAALIALFPNDYKKRADKVNEEIATLTIKIDEKKQEMVENTEKEFKPQIDELNTQIADIDSQITTLESENTDLTKKIEEKEKAEAEKKKQEENDALADNSDTSGSSEAEVDTETDPIKRAENAARKYIGSGNVGFYFIDLNSGRSFGINEDKIYYAASTAKLPAILYTQKLLNEGSISASSAYEYQDYVNDIPGAMIRGGTGKLQGQVSAGSTVEVSKLLHYTCSYSDNLASNMLGYYVCEQNSGNFKSYISNVIGRQIGTFAKEFSAKETALLMKGVYNQGGSAINHLKKTSWDSVKIPKYLPVTVAHKIGINGQYNHDVAVVYADNPYIISIMTSGKSDSFISELSKRVYNALK